MYDQSLGHVQIYCPQAAQGPIMHEGQIRDSEDHIHDCGTFIHHRYHGGPLQRRGDDFASRTMKDNCSSVTIM